jgi:uncharacterized membrane protein
MSGMVNALVARMKTKSFWVMVIGFALTVLAKPIAAQISSAIHLPPETIQIVVTVLGALKTMLGGVAQPQFGQAIPPAQS